MTAATSITVRVPLKIRRRPGRKTVVTPVAEEGGDAAIPTRADPTLVKALARAFRWKRMLESGEFATISELAEREGIATSYMTRLLRLTQLEPGIIEAVLDGRQGDAVTLARFMDPFPISWIEQKNTFLGT